MILRRAVVKGLGLHAAVLIALLSFGVEPLSASEDSRVVLDFAAKQSDLSVQSQSVIQSLAEKGKSSTDFYVIQSQTLGLKPSSFAYLVEMGRSLKIFQGLVRFGIDPARIRLEPVKAEGAGVSVIVHSKHSVQQTKLLSGVESKQSQLEEVTFSFQSASAEPMDVSGDSVSTLVESVGQPGHDALEISGQADPTGNASYNVALSELRALRVYEILVRKGLPPYRITTKGLGAVQTKGRKLTEAEKQLARRVTVRWVKDEAVARKAAEEDKKIEPQEAQKISSPLAGVSEAQPAPAETVKAEAVPAKGEELQYRGFAGALLPVGRLSKHARQDLFYGLGLSTEHPAEHDRFFRIEATVTGPASLGAKEDDRAGDLRIQFLSLGLNFGQRFAWGAAYLGLGTGAYKWSGTITQSSTGLSRSKNTVDAGFSMMTGADWKIFPIGFAGMDLSLHTVVGGFKATLMTSSLYFRWEF